MKSVILLVLLSLLNYAALHSDEIFFGEVISKQPIPASIANKPNDDTTDLTPSIGGACITPDGEQGECLPIDDCPVLANLFANPMNGSKEFIYKFKCNRDAHLAVYVCCISGWNSTNYGIGLSDRRFCGYQHTDDYLYKGNTTSIDEFPWLAAIVGHDPAIDKDRIVCHGSLINNRYILTSAYCISYKMPRYETPKVLLGKYIAENTTGCIDHEEYGLECTETQEFGIEKEIRHPFYDYNHVFNIALIRLNKTTSYTDYIRPICFPTQGTKFPEVGETLYTTGWGGGVHHDEYAPVKKKVKNILITSEECQKRLREGRVSSTYYICTLGLENISEYPCFYDGGVPVMYSYRNQWQIEGIVQSGSTCRTTRPLLHTRVYPYIDWVKQNVRP